MFEEFNFDTLMERMLSNVSDDLDKREGSVIYDALAPTALELAETYVALNMVMNEVFADSASYYYLIKRAAERGLFPKEETYAIGKMVVTPTNVTIAAGERFNLDTMNYTVIESVDGEDGAYKIQCETAGTVGNQQLGTLLPIEYVEGLETAELTEILIPGEDEEDVEVFRERYFASFNDEAFGGNKADYINKVTSIDGVGTCKIIRMWEKGYAPAKMIPTESVKTWFESQSASTLGSEVYDWLSTVYNAAIQKLLTTGGTIKIIFLTSEYKAPSETLVKMVQETLDPSETAGEGDGTLPIGHVVNVVGASNEQINFDFSISYQTGYSFPALEEDIHNAIDSYFEGLRQEWSDSDNTVIRTSRIVSLLLNITGIEDVANVTINGVNTNLTLDMDKIPVRGSVSG